MKLALINPGHESPLLFPPLSLITLAGYIRKMIPDIELKVIDEVSGQDVFGEIEKFKPDIVGITALTMFANRAYFISDNLRSKGYKTVIGGIHASIMPEEAKEHADIVIKGDGERAFVDILNNKIDKGIVSGSPIQNLDEIPIPARDLMDMNFYKNQEQVSGFELKAERISTSRGCPYSCIFCRNSIDKSPVRFFSAERIADEIEDVLKYGVEAIGFYDDNFLMNKKRIIDLFNMLDKRNLKFKWDCQTSVNMVQDLDFLKFLKEKGCLQIAFGFESGSPRILKILNKHNTIEDSELAIANCKKAGIKIRGCFILGSPTETKEDIKMTEDFIDRNKIDFVEIFLMTPYPGTQLWEYCKNNNLIPENIDWSKFTTGYEVEPFCNTTIPLGELKKIHAKLRVKYKIKSYKKMHLIKRIAKNPRIALHYIKTMVS